jgi:hypothetical protein
MRRLLIFLILALVACQNSEEPSVKAERTSSLDEFIRIPTTPDGKISKEEMAIADFDHISYNFDTIIQGEKISHEFRFQNTGAVPFVIADVSSSCGCTIPEYEEKPVPPGETGTIKAVFNSEGRKGEQHKTISIYANTIPNPIELRLEGYVQTQD